MVLRMLTSSAFRFSTFAEKSYERGQKQKDMPRYQQQQKVFKKLKDILE